MIASFDYRGRRVVISEELSGVLAVHIDGRKMQGSFIFARIAEERAKAHIDAQEVQA
jgi:hypothetical protein